MNDNIADAGAQAWHEGKSSAACPFKDSYERGDYWNSPSGLRQRWLQGYNLTARNNEIMGKCLRWRPREQWSPMD